jgi:hypothetical protein
MAAHDGSFDRQAQPGTSGKNGTRKGFGVIEMHAARVAPEKTVSPAVLPCVSYRSAMEKRMKMTYAEQLKHPNWQRKRLERLEVARFECEDCGSGEKTLHVHHKQYVKGRMAWEYQNDELAVLCEDCHETEHRLQVDCKELVEQSFMGSGDVFALLGGFNAINCMKVELVESAWRECPLTFESGLVGFLSSLLSYEQRRELAEHIRGLLEPGWQGHFDDFLRKYFERAAIK